MGSVSKGIVAAMIIVPLSLSTLNASTIDGLDDALWSWDPLSVEKESDVLTIVLPQRRITDTIFKAVISSGVCMFAGTGRIDLGDTREVAVINQFQAQGWIFEGGQAECEEMVEIPSGQLDLFILGRSRLL